MIWAMRARRRRPAGELTQFYAAQELLNRGHARPATAVTGEGGAGPAPVNLTVGHRTGPPAWRLTYCLSRRSGSRTGTVGKQVIRGTKSLKTDERFAVGEGLGERHE